MELDTNKFKIMMLAQAMRQVQSKANKVVDDVETLIAQRLRNIPRHAKKYAAGLHPEGDVYSDMPEIVIVAGSPGSGKSLVVNALSSNVLYQNYSYYSYLDYIKPVVGDEENGFIEDAEDVLVETILTATNQREYIAELKNAGCKITMYYVGTESPMININRIARKAILKEKECDIDKVYSRFFKSLAGAISLIDHINDLYLLDNSEDGEAPVIVGHFHDGKLMSGLNENAPDWARLFLSKT